MQYRPVPVFGNFILSFELTWLRNITDKESEKIYIFFFGDYEIKLKISTKHYILYSFLMIAHLREKLFFEIEMHFMLFICKRNILALMMEYIRIK